MRVAVSTMIAILATTSISQAQSTRPATAPAYETQLIRRSAPTAETTATTKAAMQGESSPAPTKLVDIRRLILSLAIVLALIFVLHGLGKYFFPNATGARSHPVVRVLARSSLAPKRHVLLVQVGRRVLVVADNGTQMNSLSEITDPDEIANLIGQIAGPHAGSEPVPDQAFDAAFGKAKTSFEASQDDAQSTENPTDRPSEMPDPALAEVEPSADGTGDVATAHGEINGLMEKVRRLTQQLSRS